MKDKCKRNTGYTLLYACMMILSSIIVSCDSPTNPEDVELVTEDETDGPVDQETTPENEPDIIQADDPVEESPVIEDPVEDQPVIESTGEDEPEKITEDPGDPEEEEMKLQPIEVYGAYAVCEDGKVYGLTGTGMIPIVLKDSKDNEFPFSMFYKDGGILYFSVQFLDESEKMIEEFYKQEDEKVTKIKTFPEIPESARVEMDDEPFKIVNAKSGKVDCSYVYQGEQPTGYIVIDGYYKTDEGLWFSVPESYGNPAAKRLRGLYFFHLNGNIQTVGEYGRVF